MQETLAPPLWETERLRISDARRQEAPQLTAACNACSYVQPWDPTFHPVEEKEILELIDRSIETDDDSEERFRMQAVRLRESGATIGYYHCIYGKPEPDDVWISICIIRPEFQRHRYGRELVEGLASIFAGLGYRALKLDVSLKNWPALRFWTRVGFTRVVEIRGDAVHGETTQARIRLLREL
jgi:ribosomal protein S18 acetylase RimI-like enzyme